MKDRGFFSSPIHFIVLGMFIVIDECDTHHGVVVVVVGTWDLRTRQRFFRAIWRARTG
jgi:hypothetical protein